MRHFVFAVAVLGAPAMGQSFNLDIGDPSFPVPASTFAAATSQSGTWNAFGDVNNIWPLTLPLVDTTGGATIVTGTGTNPGPNQLGNFSFDNALTFGDDEALLDDLLDVGGATATSTWTFTGLTDGCYEVTSYCWAPDSATFRTNVAVTGSIDPPIDMLGGDFSAGFVEEITHVSHRVSITGGADLEIIYSTVSGFGSVNGIQIAPSTDCSLGTNFCVATPNSTGFPADISASGSSSVADNDLTLMASPVPDQPGLFFFGPGQQQTAFGNGFLCVTQPIVRIQPPAAAVGNMATRSVDLPTFGIVAGSNNFQYWYRDPAGLGAFFNLSDGLEITFVP